MKKSGLIVFCCFLLLATSGCAIFSGHSGENDKMAVQYDDAGIRSSIAADLLRKDSAAADNVEVQCYRGHVFLMGEASPQFRAFAVNHAKSIKNVKNVTTQWFKDGTSNKMQDARLAANIEGKLLFEDDLSSVQMSVSVFGGNVVLCGALPDKASREKAIAITRRVEGVKSVTSYLVN